uniref:Phosphate transporter n=1 Tax=Caenorhabditis tropicalis TaxID=1561998 RepID=A0A1I7U6R4_9PELO
MIDIYDIITSTAAGGVNLSDFRSCFLWALIVGICLAFLLGFGMGANDVSNAFGTSVGSGALTLIQAYFLATIFETLGAVLVGYNVIDTMRKGVVDVAVYNNSAGDFMIGQVACLGGTATWLLIATFLHLPVSTTHAVVGATLGFSIACKGFQGIQWMMVVNIVASWFISPIFSGCVSLCLYLFVDHVILRTSNPVANGLMWLPIFYFVCLTFNMFMISYQGSKVLHLSTVPLWIAILLSLAAGVIAAAVCHFLVVPRIKKYIAKGGKTAETRDSNASSIVISVTEDPEMDKVAIRSGSTISTISSDSPQSPPPPQGKVKKFFAWLLPNQTRTESPDTLRMFTSVQTLTACFAGFAHGANDVCNAIAPLVALIAVYRDFDVYQKKKLQSTCYSTEFSPFVLDYGALDIR